ncbi:MAG: GreA/GreB family elongation factor [Blastochloris sp.]|nr:GreA/GreB family elongation factor [Blastochloris sp.]
MDSDIQQLVDSEQLPLNLAEKLDLLAPGRCCFHRSWGTGRIAERDIIANRLLIDFPNKPRHPMDFKYSATSLELLEEDHIESRKLINLAAVQAEAVANPLATMRSVVKSLQPAASPDRIEMVLCPSVVAKADWKKWWEAAKRAMKKDGHFTLPTKRSETIVLHEAPPDLGAQAVESVSRVIGPKAKLAALEETLKYSKDLKDHALMETLVADIDETLLKVPSSQLVYAVELAIIRDELIEAAGLEGRIPASATIKLLPREPKLLVNLINNLTASKQGKAIGRAAAIYGVNWPTFTMQILPMANGRVAEVIIESFEKDGRKPEIIAAIERLIRERNLHFEFLIWICKTKDADIRKLYNVQLIYAILSVLEMDQLEGSKRSGRLQDLFVTRKELISEMLKSAGDDEVRDITRAIMISPIFDELDKRSVLAAMVKLYPFIQEMIIGGGSSKDKDKDAGALIVSWESLERRKEELIEIVQVKIPQNTKDIAIARSYGDLRENSEFKMAKEMQAVLMRRRSEIESMLLRAQGTDFKNVDTAVVNIGTIVTLTDAKTNEKLVYTILGAWDSVPEKFFVAYLTAVGQVLLQKKVGDVVELPLENDKVRPVRIDAIKAYNP